MPGGFSHCQRRAKYPPRGGSRGGYPRGGSPLPPGGVPGEGGYPPGGSPRGGPPGGVRIPGIPGNRGFGQVPPETRESTEFGPKQRIPRFWGSRDTYIKARFPRFREEKRIAAKGHTPPKRRFSGLSIDPAKTADFGVSGPNWPLFSISPRFREFGPILLYSSPTVRKPTRHPFRLELKLRPRRGPIAKTMCLIYVSSVSKNFS